MRPIRTLVVGLGNMGISHALAHQRHEGSELVALVNRSAVDLPRPLSDTALYFDYEAALEQLKPELVVIATYADSHADYAAQAMQSGAHIFVEKPLATNVADAKRVVELAKKCKRKLVVGYILRHHPSWRQLVEEARNLGGPYVFRFNLNQQSHGDTWKTHKALMQSTSPIVDCGVHYVDVMCQITDTKPVRVHGMGLCLCDEIDQQMYNYGQFQVVFADGSVGWYEAGWGPMMSEIACFVKDVISPNGAISILSGMHPQSDSVEGHTKVGALRIHRTDGSGRDIAFANEPDHQALCDSEQAFVLEAITENIDLTRHMQDAVCSLAVCLAADESVRSGKVIDL